MIRVPDHMKSLAAVKLAVTTSKGLAATHDDIEQAFDVTSMIRVAPDLLRLTAALYNALEQLPALHNELPPSVRHAMIDDFANRWRAELSKTLRQLNLNFV